MCSWPALMPIHGVIGLVLEREGGVGFVHWRARPRANTSNPTDCFARPTSITFPTGMTSGSGAVAVLLFRPNFTKPTRASGTSMGLSVKDILTEKDQFELSKIFMMKLGFDFSRGRIDKSLHPFCGGSTDDIRITTRFNEKDSFSCFDALMHETGHALYEQGLPHKWAHQPLGFAGGMSLHESQSLFIEMQIVKSRHLSNFIYKTLVNKLNKNSKLCVY